jgi:SAM-dependent methyltransferase
MNTQNPIAKDMRVLDSLLRENVAPHLRAKAARDLRVLNLACGRCDEAETLVKFAKAQAPGDVRLIGADIRIREILQARERHTNLPAEFLLEDATKLGAHKEIGQEFDMVLLRHQNFWHDPELWKKIFEQGLDRAGDDGLLVITSYFDKEHRLALDALRKLGADVVLSMRNERSRGLSSPGKSVDKHIAVLRRRK